MRESEDSPAINERCLLLIAAAIRLASPRSSSLSTPALPVPQPFPSSWSLSVGVREPPPSQRR